jgi:hypothetical protein
MKWEAKIIKIHNGYILTTRGDAIASRVVEEREDPTSDGRKEEIEAFVRLTKELADHFGIYNSKHEKYNFVCETRNAN